MESDRLIQLEHRLGEAEKANAELRDSEARYRTLFESLDEGFAEIDLITDDDGRVVDRRYLKFNPAFYRLTGMPDVTGMLISESLPDLEPEWGERYTQLLTTGEPVRFEQYAETIDMWLDVYAVLVGGSGSRRAMLVYNNITARKRAEAALRASEERQAFLLKLSDTLRPLSDARAIKAAAAALVGRSLNVASAGYAEVEPDGLAASITDEYNDGRIPGLTARYVLRDFGSVTEAMARGETIHFADLDDEEVSPDAQAAFSAINVRSAVAMPLVKNGAMVAYLFVAHPEPRAWSAADLDILREVTERTWEAVERARAQAALRAS